MILFVVHHSITKLIPTCLFQMTLSMKLTFVTASLLCSLAAAAPHDLEPKGHDYQREKPGDSQSSLTPQFPNQAD